MQTNTTVVRDSRGLEEDDGHPDFEADALGLTPGGTYSLDLFHAERHSAGSTFRVDATLAFTDCGVVAVD